VIAGWVLLWHNTADEFTAWGAIMASPRPGGVRAGGLKKLGGQQSTLPVFSALDDKIPVESYRTPIPVRWY
jgi:hypothetical protein